MVHVYAPKRLSMQRFHEALAGNAHEDSVKLCFGKASVLGFMNKRNELEAYTIEGSVDSDVVIHCFNAFCQTIEGPTVVVVDNASIHTSEAFQEAIPTWEKQGLSVFYLPEYSPELSLIEILWRFMKYEWIEFWAYTDFASLIQYVEGVIKGFGDQYKINFE